MTAPQHEFTKLGFTKTFILPAMWIFLVPALSWMFFLHAQSRFDAQALEAILQQIRIDQKLSEQERAQATEFYTKVPYSQLMTNPEFAVHVDPTARFNYATFRWMIRLSFLSIAAGITVFVVAGILVLLSFRSPFVQYLSLLAGWHVLRIYSALQTIVIGIQLVALSFWGTALWMNFYSVKLIGVAGLLSVVGVGAVLVAIFASPRTEQTVEGTILERDAAPRLWEELSSICAKVGVDPPDQVIAGIDDNFFVTEHPITMNGTRMTGKTLFVSLPLLKQLHATEADTILAHEMAHFSGQDTLYSKRISPLLMKYQAYLKGLHEGGISLPVFHFMVCFRVLFELSLNSLSRKREFRADAIASKVTSPRDSAAALLRTMAYSKFRQSVELDLFKQTEAMEKADVSARVEQGFLDYAEK
ncbi:MAG: M48 family metallopeptidase, partial [Planctomycetota bacterium]